MAIDTDQELLNKVIYEVYVRNHSNEGDFKGLQKDLARIKRLGVDIIWLMPIHPIGQIQKKNSLGCPYSIQDYRKINPEYGTLEEFINLVTAIHELGLKIIIDIVFNHTSHDSWLLSHHPEWFYHMTNGEIGSKVEDWADVVDLDYTHPDLWDYQIDTLKYWAGQGIDGFRCDVAPLIPIQFWLQARSELRKIKPDLIWIAESCGPSFIADLRRQGFIAHSDCELYQAFDITYDYDDYDVFQAYLQGQAALKEYLNLNRQQETIYPANYIKLRFLENHDQPRIKSMVSDEKSLLQWTAFIYFEKGTTLLYAGQETLDPKTPSLFKRDLVDWSGLSPEFCDVLTKLAALKKTPIFSHGYYQIHHVPESGIILASYQYKQQILYGIFNVEAKCGFLKVDCKDGQYQNLINGESVNIQDSLLELQTVPIIFTGRDSWKVE
jgi:glycosidase